MNLPLGSDEGIVHDSFAKIKVNLSTHRSKSRGLLSTRAQAEGLEVHPEPCFSAPLEKRGSHGRTGEFGRKNGQG
jgi:hypothetical protein